MSAKFLCQVKIKYMLAQFSCWGLAPDIYVHVNGQFNRPAAVTFTTLPIPTEELHHSSPQIHQTPHI